MNFDVIRDRSALRFIADEARPSGLAPVRKSARAAAAVAWIRNWLHNWAERRRERAVIAALARLDDVTLRDLGIGRSEFGSIAAESLGRAATTRTRIRRTNGEVFGDPRNIVNVDHYR